MQDCLALGVIFAATDSVAVLQVCLLRLWQQAFSRGPAEARACAQVLQQDRMPLLYSLVFGEGVINDATSVALLRAVQVLPA